MDLLFFLELFAVVTGLGFIILMIYQNIWCWPIGILSSLASIYLFFCLKLYAESVLYVYYVLIGIYGWYTWQKSKGNDFLVQLKGWRYNTIAIVVGILMALPVGVFLNRFTDGERPFADALSSVFSLIASYMEAHKVLSSWFFWIAINAFSIWLYLDRGLKMYSGLMVIYFLLSVAGYLQWKHSHEKSLGAKQPHKDIVASS